MRITLQYKNKTSIPLCDIFSEAMLGVVKAVDSFDFYENSHFSSYVSLWIKQHIDRFINDYGRIIRIPVYLNEKISKAISIYAQNHEFEDKTFVLLIIQELEVSEEEAKLILEYIKSEEIYSIEELLESEIDIYTYDSLYLEDSIDEVVMKLLLRENIDLAMEMLTDREKQIISLRYGLDKNRNGMTLEDVGQMMNITRERVRQIEFKGIEKLRHSSCSKYLKDFVSYFYEKDEKDYVV